jgi:hypothetical protein
MGNVSNEIIISNFKTKVYIPKQCAFDDKVIISFRRSIHKNLASLWLINLKEIVYLTILTNTFIVLRGVCQKRHQSKSLFCIHFCNCSFTPYNKTAKYITNNIINENKINEYKKEKNPKLLIILNKISVR